MHLTKRVRLQLVFFMAVTLIAGGAMAFDYLGLPNALFGVGHYRVTVSLPVSGGLYPNGNVTYRGTEVGRIDDVRLSSDGVDAVLSLRSNVKIPANLDAYVHAQTAIGEQFVELVPRDGGGPALKDGDVIPQTRAKIPPDINALLRATNNGLTAIPHDSLKTLIDESYTAVGGLGPDLARLMHGTTKLAADARTNLGALTTIIDQSAPVLDTQTGTSDAIHSWAMNLAAITDQLRTEDPALKGVLTLGPGATDETRALFEQLQPTLPILLNNLVGIADAAVTFQPNLEQFLVLLPMDTAVVQASELMDRDVTQYKGINISFNLNLNVPPPCTTGYLPAQQIRSASEVDYPQRPPGLLYCRVPQDSPLNVRGARNIPCETKPGKRAPTVKLCESDENYVPLNDGFNWKGDPNATLSGQPVPQLPPVPSGIAASPPPPIAVAQYDPDTGTYMGPDGKQYTQANLARDAPEHPTWQDMLIPPQGR